MNVKQPPTPVQELIQNAATLGLSLKAVGFIARFLIAARVPEYLEEKATATNTGLDDAIFGAVIAIIRQAAKL